MNLPLAHACHVETYILNMVLQWQKLIQILDSHAQLFAQRALVLLLLPLLHEIQYDYRRPVSPQKLIEMRTCNQSDRTKVTRSLLGAE